VSFLKQYIFHVQVIIFTLLGGACFGGTGDTLAPELSPKAAAIVASIGEMSEPELVLIMDSLLDAKAPEKELIKVIQEEIRDMQSTFVKNDPSAFEFYPANRFYGSWDTRHLFPYSDSLYKSDTLTALDLSPGISGEFYFPFNGPITSSFGWRDSAYHRGIDIDLNYKDTVRASFAGMVRFAGKMGGYGNVIIIRHYNGLETVYGHLARLKVKAGDIVNSGQLIGLGGSTGHSTGTHLHFELRFRGVAFDPAYVIDLKTQQLSTEKFALYRTRQGFAVRPDGLEYHTVVRGDNYTKIAQHYGISIKQLKTYNGWEGYVKLKAGMQVRVVPAAELRTGL
jgi:murein DD-endopeptidase MepM/ murein hydrolase activator NlpD